MLNAVNKVLLIRGHPFMTFTQRGESGSGGRMWTGVKPHVDVHIENKN